MISEEFALKIVSDWVPPGRDRVKMVDEILDAAEGSMLIERTICRYIVQQSIASVDSTHRQTGRFPSLHEVLNSVLHAIDNRDDVKILRMIQEQEEQPDHTHPSW